MDRSNRKKRHRVKPVYERISYYTNILKIVAHGEPKKSENEICNSLKALHKEGLNYKRDAIDAIHILSRNQILNISKSANHPQRYDVQLAPLGHELVSLWKNIDQSITIYNDLKDTVERSFIVDHEITDYELKAKLLSKNWRLEDIPFHDQRLKVAFDFLVKSLFAIISTLSTSYVRLQTKTRNNEAAKAILNHVFSDTLKKGLTMPTNRQEEFIDDVMAQMELPITSYFVDYCYNKELHADELLEGKPQNLLNSIYSIIKPGKGMDFNNLLNYIMTLKEKNILSTQQGLFPI